MNCECSDRQMTLIEEHGRNEETNHCQGEKIGIFPIEMNTSQSSADS